MSEKQQGWVYLDGDKVVYRTYSIGSCIRSLVAARLGEDPYPPNATFRKAMDDSAGLEDEILRMYAYETGHPVLWRQKEFDLDVMDKLVIRCHIDGLDQTEDCITEVKALGDTNWKLFNEGGLDALPGYLGHKYKWQAAVQGYATGRRVKFVVGHKTKNEKTGQFSIDEIIREPAYPPETFVPIRDIHDKVMTVERYAAEDELPECDQKCREGDPYGEVHFFDSPTAGDEDLHALLVRRDTLYRQVWELSSELEDVNDAIKEQCGEGKFTAGKYTAKISWYHGGRCNTGRLKKERPDVYEEYYEPSAPSLRLNVDGGWKKPKRERGERDG